MLLTALFAPIAHAGNTNGPTIQLHFSEAQPGTNTVEEFMYFVPLISFAPITSSTSPHSTQSLRMTSSKRKFSRHSFVVTCEIELAGEGTQKNIFDTAPAIRQNEEKLKKGEVLPHQLRSIAIQGSGEITVEVEGTVENDVPTVTEVRLHFNARGHASPVTIDLCDLHKVGGEIKPAKEILARVNMLTFRRAGDPPKMDVSIASVKNKEAGDGFWQNFKGRVVGAAANMLIDPLKIKTVGNKAMMDFGKALVSGAPTFTFPLATNLHVEAPRQ